MCIRDRTEGGEHNTSEASAGSADGAPAARTHADIDEELVQIAKQQMRRMAEEGSEDPEWVVATQQGLGSLIKRPKLTTPLLMKPPFRFLHDIVSEVMRTCGFAEGLYDENESQSSKIKDKESKLAYLNKIMSVCLLYTSPSPRDQRGSRMPSSA